MTVDYIKSEKLANTFSKNITCDIITDNTSLSCKLFTTTIANNKLASTYLSVNQINGSYGNPSTSKNANSIIGNPPVNNSSLAIILFDTFTQSTTIYKCVYVSSDTTNCINIYASDNNILTIDNLPLNFACQVQFMKIGTRLNLVVLENSNYIFYDLNIDLSTIPANLSLIKPLTLCCEKVNFTYVKYSSTEKILTFDLIPNGSINSGSSELLFSNYLSKTWIELSEPSGAHDINSPSGPSVPVKGFILSFDKYTESAPSGYIDRYRVNLSVEKNVSTYANYNSVSILKRNDPNNLLEGNGYITPNTKEDGFSIKFKDNATSLKAKIPSFLYTDKEILVDDNINYLCGDNSTVVVYPRSTYIIIKKKVKIFPFDYKIALTTLDFSRYPNSQTIQQTPIFEGSNNLTKAIDNIVNGYIGYLDQYDYCYSNINDIWRCTSDNKIHTVKPIGNVITNTPSFTYSIISITQNLDGRFFMAAKIITNGATTYKLYTKKMLCDYWTYLEYSTVDLDIGDFQLPINETIEIRSISYYKTFLYACVVINNIGTLYHLELENENTCDFIWEETPSYGLEGVDIKYIFSKYDKILVIGTINGVKNVYTFEDTRWNILKENINSDIIELIFTSRVNEYYFLKKEQGINNLYKTSLALVHTNFWDVSTWEKVNITTSGGYLANIKTLFYVPYMCSSDNISVFHVNDYSSVNAIYLSFDGSFMVQQNDKKVSLFKYETTAAFDEKNETGLDFSLNGIQLNSLKLKDNIRTKADLDKLFSILIENGDNKFTPFLKLLKDNSLNLAKELHDMFYLFEEGKQPITNIEGNKFLETYNKLLYNTNYLETQSVYQGFSIDFLFTSILSTWVTIIKKYLDSTAIPDNIDTYFGYVSTTFITVYLSKLEINHDVADNANFPSNAYDGYAKTFYSNLDGYTEWLPASMSIGYKNNNEKLWSQAKKIEKEIIATKKLLIDGFRKVSRLYEVIVNASPVGPNGPFGPSGPNLVQNPETPDTPYLFTASEFLDVVGVSGSLESKDKEDATQIYTRNLNITRHFMIELSETEQKIIRNVILKMIKALYDKCKTEYWTKFETLLATKESKDMIDNTEWPSKESIDDFLFYESEYYSEHYSLFDKLSSNEIGNYSANDGVVASTDSTSYLGSIHSYINSYVNNDYYNQSSKTYNKSRENYSRYSAYMSQLRVKFHSIEITVYNFQVKCSTILNTLTYLYDTLLDFKELIGFNTGDMPFYSINNKISHLRYGPYKAKFSSIVFTDLGYIYNKETNKQIYLQNIVLMYNALYTFMITEINAEIMKNTGLTILQSLYNIRDDLQIFNSERVCPNTTNTGFSKNFTTNSTDYTMMRNFLVGSINYLLRLSPVDNETYNTTSYYNEYPITHLVPHTYNLALIDSAKFPATLDNLDFVVDVPPTPNTIEEFYNFYKFVLERIIHYSTSDFFLSKKNSYDTYVTDFLNIVSSIYLLTSSLISSSISDCSNIIRPLYYNLISIKNTNSSFGSSKDIINVSQKSCCLIDGYTLHQSVEETENILYSKISDDGVILITLTSTNLKMYNKENSIPFFNKVLKNAKKVESSYDASVVLCATENIDKRTNSKYTTLNIYKLIDGTYQHREIVLYKIFDKCTISKCGNIINVYDSYLCKIYVWIPYSDNIGGNWVLYNNYYTSIHYSKLSNNNNLALMYEVKQRTVKFEELSTVENIESAFIQTYAYQQLKLFKLSLKPKIINYAFNKENRKLTLTLFQPKKLNDFNHIGYEISVNDELYSNVFLNEIGMSTLKNKDILYKVYGTEKYPTIIYNDQNTPENIVIYNKLLKYIKILSSASTNSINRTKEEYTEDYKNRIKNIIATEYLDSSLSQLLTIATNVDERPKTITYSSTFEDLIATCDMQYETLLTTGEDGDKYNKSQIKAEKYEQLLDNLRAYLAKIKGDHENSVDEIDNEVEAYITNGTLKMYRSPLSTEVPPWFLFPSFNPSFKGVQSIGMSGQVANDGAAAYCYDEINNKIQGTALTDVQFLTYYKGSFYKVTARGDIKLYNKYTETDFVTSQNDNLEKLTLTLTAIYNNGQEKLYKITWAYKIYLYNDTTKTWIKETTLNNTYIYICMTQTSTGIIYFIAKLLSAITGHVYLLCRKKDDGWGIDNTNIICETACNYILYHNNELYGLSEDGTKLYKQSSDGKLTTLVKSGLASKSLYPIYFGMYDNVDISSNTGWTPSIKTVIDSIDSVHSRIMASNSPDKTFFKGCFQALKTAYYFEVFKAYYLCYGVIISDAIKNMLLYLKNDILNFDELIKFDRNTNDTNGDSLVSKTNAIKTGFYKEQFSSVVLIVPSLNKENKKQTYLKNIVLLYKAFHTFINTQIDAELKNLSTTNKKQLTSIQTSLKTFYSEWGPNATSTDFSKEFITSSKNYTTMRSSLNSIVDTFNSWFSNNIPQYMMDKELQKVTSSDTNNTIYTDNLNKQPIYIKNIINSIVYLKQQYPTHYSLLFPTTPDTKYNELINVLKDNSKYSSVNVNSKLTELSIKYDKLSEELTKTIQKYGVRGYYYIKINETNQPMTDIYNGYCKLYTVYDTLNDMLEMNTYYNQTNIFALQLMLQDCKRLVKEEGNIYNSEPLNNQFNTYINKASSYLESSLNPAYQTLLTSITTAKTTLNTKITNQKFSKYDFYMYKYIVSSGSVLNRKIGDTAHPIEHLNQTHLIASEYHRDITNAIGFFKNKHQFNPLYLTYLAKLNKIKQFVDILSRCSNVNEYSVGDSYFKWFKRTGYTFASEFEFLINQLIVDLNQESNDATVNSSLKVKLEKLNGTKISALLDSINSLKTSMESIDTALDGEIKSVKEQLSKYTSTATNTDEYIYSKYAASVATLGYSDVAFLGYELSEAITDAINTNDSVTVGDFVCATKDIVNDQLTLGYYTIPVDPADISDSMETSSYDNAVSLAGEIAMTATGRKSRKRIAKSIGGFFTSKAISVVEKNLNKEFIEEFEELFIKNGVKEFEDADGNITSEKPDKNVLKSRRKQLAKKIGSEISKKLFKSELADDALVETFTSSKKSGVASLAKKLSSTLKKLLKKFLKKIAQKIVQKAVTTGVAAIPVIGLAVDFLGNLVFATIDLVISLDDKEAKIAEYNKIITNLEDVKANFKTVKNDLDTVKQNILYVINTDNILTETDSLISDDMRYILDMTIDKLTVIKQRVEDYTCYMKCDDKYVIKSNDFSSSSVLIKKSYEVYNLAYTINVSLNITKNLNNSTSLDEILEKQKNSAGTGYLMTMQTKLSNLLSYYEPIYKANTVYYYRNSDGYEAYTTWDKAWSTSTEHKDEYLTKFPIGINGFGLLLYFLRSKSSTSHWDYFHANQVDSYGYYWYNKGELNNRHYTSSLHYTTWAILKVLVYLTEKIKTLITEADSTSKSQYPVLFSKLYYGIQMVTAFCIADHSLLSTDMTITYSSKALSASYRYKMYRHFFNRTLNNFKSVQSFGMSGNDSVVYCYDETNDLIYTTGLTDTISLTYYKGSFIKLNKDGIVTQFNELYSKYTAVSFDMIHPNGYAMRDSQVIALSIHTIYELGVEKLYKITNTGKLYLYDGVNRWTLVDTSSNYKYLSMTQTPDEVVYFTVKNIATNKISLCRKTDNWSVSANNVVCDVNCNYIMYYKNELYGLSTDGKTLCKQSSDGNLTTVVKSNLSLFTLYPIYFGISDKAMDEYNFNINASSLTTNMDDKSLVNMYNYYLYKTHKNINSINKDIESTDYTYVKRIANKIHGSTNQITKLLTYLLDYNSKTSTMTREATNIEDVITVDVDEDTVEKFSITPITISGLSVVYEGSLESFGIAPSSGAIVENKLSVIVFTEKPTIVMNNVNNNFSSIQLQFDINTTYLPSYISKYGYIIKNIKTGVSTAFQSYTQNINHTMSFIEKYSIQVYIENDISIINSDPVEYASKIISNPVITYKKYLPNELRENFINININFKSMKNKKFFLTTTPVVSNFISQTYTTITSNKTIDSLSFNQVTGSITIPFNSIFDKVYCKSMTIYSNGDIKFMNDDNLLFKVNDSIRNSSSLKTSYNISGTSSSREITIKYETNTTEFRVCFYENQEKFRTTVIKQLAAVTFYWMSFGKLVNYSLTKTSSINSVEITPITNTTNTWFFTENGSDFSTIVPLTNFNTNYTFYINTITLISNVYTSTNLDTVSTRSPDYPISVFPIPNKMNGRTNLTKVLTNNYDNISNFPFTGVVGPSGSSGSSVPVVNYLGINYNKLSLSATNSLVAFGRTIQNINITPASKDNPPLSKILLGSNTVSTVSSSQPISDYYTGTVSGPSGPIYIVRYERYNVI
jgi:hypothetical protein